LLGCDAKLVSEKIRLQLDHLSHVFGFHQPSSVVK
jgi:hypothetical protein